MNTVLAVLLLEGIGRQLDPGMDLFKSSLPILRQLGGQMSAREAMEGIPRGNFAAMLKIWVWIEARELVSGAIVNIDEMVRYDWYVPSCFPFSFLFRFVPISCFATIGGSLGSLSVGERPSYPALTCVVPPPPNAHQLGSPHLPHCRSVRCLDSFGVGREIYHLHIPLHNTRREPIMFN